MTWSDTQVDMAGHADWASWTLAMTSGWVIQGELIDINEVTKVNFDIYPNPIVEDYFNISFDKSTSGVYKIFNSLGQLISSDTFEGKDIIVSDISLSAGNTGVLLVISKMILIMLIEEITQQFMTDQIQRMII